MELTNHRGKQNKHGKKEDLESDTRRIHSTCNRSLLSKSQNINNKILWLAFTLRKINSGIDIPNNKLALPQATLATQHKSQ